MFKIQHPLIEDQNISYGFFTRNGGFSKQPFNTLNCSLNINDDAINVQKNLTLIRNELDLKNIIRLHQIHSSDVIIVDKTNLDKNVYKADGLVTNVKNIGLSILGADCAPILFYDKVSKIIGACHAGWRGAINNIVENTILKMEEIGSKRKNITAIIGPTIQKNSYEIKEDVADIVKETLFFKKNKSILFSKKNKKYLFDLPLLLKESFKISQINKFGDVKIDTYLNADLFFSHRRSTHKNEGKVVKTGRQISVIGILK